MKKVLLVFLLTVSLAAAAQTKGNPFVFMPQWSAQAQFAGYYVALVNGYYADEGLDVEIVHPFASQNCVDQLLAGKVDATMMPLAQAVEGISGGAGIVNIFQTSMNNATLLISRNGLDPLKMQKGKIACWKAGYDQMARCLMGRSRRNIEWVKAASSVNVFIAGAVDATLAMTYNEYYQLRQTGLITAEKAIFRFGERGYNIQQDGVYMTRSAYAKNRERAEAFARASRRGWEWAVDHEEETLDIVMEYVKKYRIPTNRILQKLMLREILRLQLDPDSGERAFLLREDMVEKASRLMLEAGVTGRPVEYKELVP